MPTFSCLPTCTAACTSPTSCPGLGKNPCVTPAPYYSPQAFPYPATETARGATPCATKANAHQSASYACPGTHLTNILPQRLLSAVCLPVLPHTPPLAPTPALTKPQSSLLPCIALHRHCHVRFACPCFLQQTRIHLKSSLQLPPRWEYYNVPAEIAAVQTRVATSVSHGCCPQGFLVTSQHLRKCAPEESAYFLRRAS